MRSIKLTLQLIRRSWIEIETMIVLLLPNRPYLVGVAFSERRTLGDLGPHHANKDVMVTVLSSA